MLYNLAQAPPEPGSFLESAFLLLTKRRQEQEFFRTRALVEAVLAPHLEGETSVSETFSDYMNVMFPYLSRQPKKKDEMKEALDHWVGKRMFRVKPLWEAGDKPVRFRSSLQRGRERVERREQLRKAGQLRRIK